MSQGEPARRRALAFAAVGALAAGAGVGAAVWMRGRSGSDATSPAGSADGAGGLYALRFTQPNGEELALARFRGQPLLVNFWGTWCPPCVREMPVLDRFAREFAAAGWRVLGLAVDQEKPVREFLARNPVSYSIALAGFEGIALSRALGNENGGLPFTVAFDAHGRVVHRHQGETQFELLAGWAGSVPRGLPAKPR